MYLESSIMANFLFLLSLKSVNPKDSALSGMGTTLPDSLCLRQITDFQDRSTSWHSAGGDHTGDATLGSPSPVLEITRMLSRHAN